MGVIRIKEEKSLLPVDVRGSKTSLLKLPNCDHESECLYGLLDQCSNESKRFSFSLVTKQVKTLLLAEK